MHVGKGQLKDSLTDQYTVGFLVFPSFNITLKLIKLTKSGILITFFIEINLSLLHPVTSLA